MKNRKNEWIQKFGYKKLGGKIFLPVEGKQIHQGSKIHQILLDSTNKEKIEIHGKFEVIINSESTSYDNIVDDFKEFIESMIIGASIEEAWKDNRGNLTICISSDPKIQIFVDNEEIEWPIAKWTYDYKDGYITN